VTTGGYFDSDLAIAGNPDPGGIDAVCVQLLEMFVPPSRVKAASEIIPFMPGGVCAIDPNPVAPGAELSVGDRDPVAKPGLGRHYTGKGRERADNPIHGQHSSQISHNFGRRSHLYYQPSDISPPDMDWADSCQRRYLQVTTNKRQCRKNGRDMFQPYSSPPRSRSSSRPVIVKSAPSVCGS
jgi:hypothetical protein